MSQTAQKRNNVQQGSGDRRVEKTHRALRNALHDLISKKPYDEISVSDILAQANVGRSTFYLHFRDKDELLSSTIDDIIGPAAVAPRAAAGSGCDHILNFARPILEHHEQRRISRAHHMGGRAKSILHHHLNEEIYRMIVDSMAEFRPSPELLARFVASTFILTLDWWLNSKPRMSAREADSIFRALVVPTLREA